MIFVVIPDWEECLTDIPAIYSSRNENHISYDLQVVCQAVENYSSVDDRILVYGNFDIVYLITGRNHATKYSYQYPISGKDLELRDDFWNQLNAEMPKLVVVSRENIDLDIANFLIDNEYDLVYAVHEDNLLSSDQVWVRK